MFLGEMMSISLFGRCGFSWRHVSLALSLSLGARTAHSQAEPAKAPAPLFDWFANQNRISFGWPKGYIHEAQPSPTFFMHSNAPALELLATKPRGFARGGCALYVMKPLMYLVRSGIGKGGTSGLACTHAIVPRFVVRQLTDSSAAVKPSSFNPYYEYALTGLSLSGSNTDAVDARSGRLAIARLRVGHYSNGQAGCTYREQTQSQLGATCLPVVPVARKELNTDDGDFSTSYLQAGYGVGLFGLRKDGSLDHLGLIEFEYLKHFTQGGFAGWVPGSMTQSQQQTYGTWEINTRVTARKWLQKCTPRWRYFRGVALDFEANYSVAPNRASQFTNYRWDATASFSWARLRGLGSGVRLNGGYDPYNISYGRTVDRRPAFVVVFDPRTKPDRFGLSNGRSSGYACTE